MAKKEKNILAVDIGSSSIKVIEMSKVGKSYQVDRAAIEPMPKNAWKDGLPLEIDLASNAIANAIRSSGSQLKTVVTSVPTAAAMTRVLPMISGLSDDDIEATLEAGISQYLPFDASEVQIDFQKIQPIPGETNKNEVLLVAVEKKFVNDRDICIASAGCQLEAVDVDIYALANLIRLIEPIESYPPHYAVAVIDMAADRTGLHVLHGDASVYAREQPFGGDRLTEIIADLSGLSFEQAEGKKRAGIWNDEMMQQSLQTYLAELSDQIVNAMQVYQPNHPRTQIQKVILTGGGAKLPGLEQFIADAIKMPVSMLDPAHLMSLPTRVNKVSQADLRLFSVACGLAMRNLS